ncbi:hypothetical protein ACFQZI_09630 [Mucilaginibacter lutimaris]|uniref:Uncharacterized protein n=1 Tax=Mucilaginibacter lutimaris TaxID=931629 RepID=A0ABW2ZGA1_9SPHI
MMKIIEATKLISKGLSFLNNCNYLKALNNDIFENIAYQIITYSSDFNQKEIEFVLAAEREYIDIIIRRINKAADDEDDDNSVNINDAAWLLRGGEYNEETFNYNLSGRENVIANAIDLIYRNKDFFCSTNWFDMEALKKRKTEYYKNKFNIDISLYDSKDKPLYRFKEATQFLQNEGWELIQDSDTMPFYKRKVWFISFKKGEDIIKIAQADWRDSYYIYQLIFNGNLLAEINANNYKTTADMASHIKYLIKELI